MQAIYRHTDGDQIDVIGHSKSDCRSKFEAIRLAANRSQYDKKGRTITSLKAIDSADGGWTETLYSDVVTIQSVTRLSISIKSIPSRVYPEPKARKTPAHIPGASYYDSDGRFVLGNDD